ncbi:MAG: 2-amino-4-hydroxy-6-hydroxymethyldihydropteridine diphosphokinase [Lachnospiraceae bacterium]|nr:2-amino-4-hydroxy-6-hydroxymethyldihydropteridine diphosphokinase [Lachnospiraceae bacterium]
MDFIEIKQLEVFAKHGVMREENILGQKFLISLKLYLDTRSSGKRDDLDKTVNYADVATYVTDFVKENKFKLLETLAEKLAQKILIRYSLVESLDIRIEKPWAPVGLPLKTIAVEIHRGWKEAYIALGSNMGESEITIRKAIEALSAERKTRVEKISSLIKTKPMGDVEQADFVNAAICVKTLEEPEELLDLLLSLENLFQRVRDVHWGPRTLDLDLIMYDDVVMNTEKLILPHPGMCDRDFVLVPLQELNPVLTHPINKKNVTQLLKELPKDKRYIL